MARQEGRTARLRSSLKNELMKQRSEQEQSKRQRMLELSVPCPDSEKLSDEGIYEASSPSSISLVSSTISEYDESFNWPIIEVIAQDVTDSSFAYLSQSAIGVSSSELPTTVTGMESMSCPYPSTTARRVGRPRASPLSMMSEEDIQNLERNKARKDSHNAIERKRRDKINICIEEIGHLLPKEYDLDLQNYRQGHVLEKAVKYIKKLKETEVLLPELQDEQDRLTKENLRLRLHIEQMKVELANAMAASTSTVVPPVTAVQHCNANHVALTPASAHSAHSAPQLQDLGLENLSVIILENSSDSATADCQGVVPFLEEEGNMDVDLSTINASELFGFQDGCLSPSVDFDMLLGNDYSSNFMH